MKPLAALLLLAFAGCETTTVDADGDRTTTRFDSGAALDAVKAGVNTYEEIYRMQHPAPPPQYPTVIQRYP